MNKNRVFSWLMAIVLSFGMLLTPLTADAAPQSVDPGQAREDFYEAVDAKLIAGMKINDDASGTGWFYQLRNKVDEELKGYIINYADNIDSYDKNSKEYQLGALYLCAMDADTRNAYCYGTVGNKFLADVDRAQNMEELLSVVMKLDRTYGIGTLFSAGYGVDTKNVDEKVLYVSAGTAFLSKEYWFGEDDYSLSVREAARSFISTLHQINGKTKEDADALADQICTLCRTLSAATYEIQEYYDPEKLYHAYQVSDLKEIFCSGLPMDLFCSLYEAQENNRIIVGEPEYLASFGSLMTDGNLSLLKEYVKTIFYYICSDWSDMESQNALGDFQQAQEGTVTAKSPEKISLSLVKTVLNDFCSQVYVENCFDKESKIEVENMVKQVLDVYRERIIKLDWMQDATKVEAVKKINSMTVKVGYPDQWPSYMDAVRIYSPAEGGNLIDNVLNLYRISIQDSYEKREEPTDRKKWEQADAFTVNAFYMPSENAIYFPAGILQSPFYDKNASAEENWGGIGTVIGHEITHAFDNTGAKYDSKGNYRNWWTQEDLVKFEELSQRVVEYYNGYENAGLQVNGKQTLTENIADLGGVSAITEIACTEGVDRKALYNQYAWIWAVKYTPDATKMLMLSDTHSPGKIRVNAVLSSMPEFYEAYGVVPGDGMYKSPEERVSIW